MATRHARRHVMLSVLLVGLGMALLATSCHDRTSQSAHHYRPTAAEAPMFKHLRHATTREITYAQNGTDSIEQDERHPVAVDTYVATSNFTTVYTPHHMVIMLRPGVKWLGGPLGQIVLTMRITDTQYQKYWDHRPGVKREVDEFGWASVVYDPLCRAYNLGSATRAACESTLKQRAAVTAKQQSLRPLTDSEYYQYRTPQHPIWDLPVGTDIHYVWMTPVGQTTAVVPPVDVDDQVYMIVLMPGQKLTGGSLGHAQVVLPVTYHRGYDLAHVVIDDPLKYLCNSRYGVLEYLGPRVIIQHHLYCS